MSELEARRGSSTLSRSPSPEKKKKKRRVPEPVTSALLTDDEWKKNADAFLRTLGSKASSTSTSSDRHLAADQAKSSALSLAAGLAKRSSTSRPSRRRSSRSSSSSSGSSSSSSNSSRSSSSSSSSRSSSSCSSGEEGRTKVKTRRKTASTSGSASAASSKKGQRGGGHSKKKHKKASSPKRKKKPKRQPKSDEDGDRKSNARPVLTVDEHDKIKDQQRQYREVKSKLESQLIALKKQRQALKDKGTKREDASMTDNAGLQIEVKSRITYIDEVLEKMELALSYEVVPNHHQAKDLNNRKTSKTSSKARSSSADEDKEEALVKKKKKKSRRKSAGSDSTSNEDEDDEDVDGKASKQGGYQVDEAMIRMIADLTGIKISKSSDSAFMDLLGKLAEAYMKSKKDLNELQIRVSCLESENSALKDRRSSSKSQEEERAVPEAKVTNNEEEECGKGRDQDSDSSSTGTSSKGSLGVKTDASQTSQVKIKDHDAGKSEHSSNVMAEPAEVPERPAVLMPPAPVPPPAPVLVASHTEGSTKRSGSRSQMPNHKRSRSGSRDASERKQRSGSKERRRRSRSSDRRRRSRSTDRRRRSRSFERRRRSRSSDRRRRSRSHERRRRSRSNERKNGSKGHETSNNSDVKKEAKSSTSSSRIKIEEWEPESNKALIDSNSMASLKEKLKSKLAEENEKARSKLPESSTDPVERTQLWTSVEATRNEDKAAQMLNKSRAPVAIKWGGGGPSGDNADRGKATQERQLTIKKVVPFVGKMPNRVNKKSTPERDSPVVAPAAPAPPLPAAPPPMPRLSNAMMSDLSAMHHLAPITLSAAPMPKRSKNPTPQRVEMSDILAAAHAHIQTRLYMDNAPSSHKVFANPSEMEIPLPPLPAAQDKDPQALMDTRPPAIEPAPASLTQQPAEMDPAMASYYYDYSNGAAHWDQMYEPVEPPDVSQSLEEKSASFDDNNANDLAMLGIDPDDLAGFGT